MNPNLIDRAADLLLLAAKGDRLADFPVELEPRSLEEAYAIQDTVLQNAGELAGWKVAPTLDGQSPRCAGIDSANLIVNGGVLPKGLRNAEIEVEIGLKLSRDFPARPEPYSRDEIVAGISSAHVVFEVLDSRFIDRKSISILSALADAQSNRNLVVGEGIKDWQKLEFADVSPTLIMGESTVRATKQMATTEAVIDACVWLTNHGMQRKRGLRSGQIIITGSRVGPLPIPQDINMKATIAGIGNVRLKSH